jgi:ABC-type multidrug transport system fused ATPase/permease subunit
MRVFPQEIRELIQQDQQWLWLLVGIAGLIAFLEGAELVTLLLLGKGLLGQDIATAPGGAILTRYLGAYSQAQLLIRLGAVFAGVVILRLGSSLGFRYLAYLLSSKVTARLHKQIMERLVLAPTWVFDKRQLGEIIHGVMDMPAGAIWAIDGVTAFITGSFSIVLVGITLVYISPWLLAVAAGIVIPLLWSVASPSHRGVRRLHELVLERRACATELAANVINGIRDIKGLSTERQMVAAFAHEVDLWEMANARSRFVRFFPGPTLQAVVQLAFAGAVVAMASFMSTESLTTYLPALGVLGYSLFRLYPALNQESRAFMDLNRALPSLRATAEWIALPQDDLVGGTQQVSGHFSGMRFQGVSFSYNGTAPAVVDLDFCIEPGKVTSLVGESGAGKSTLLDLMLKFRAPKRGTIWLGEQNLHDVVRRSWLRHVGVVRQDVFLFAGTIRQNLLAWKPDATEQEMLSACRRAGALDFIRDLPDGLDTVVGERGVTLSGGQRQRIAIARGLLRNPQVLILDEALSALDGETEAEVLQSLLVDAPHCTIILVSHRLTTIQHSDHIIVLDRGRVVEQGTHAELLAKRGRYSELFATQIPDASRVYR